MDWNLGGSIVLRRKGLCGLTFPFSALRNVSSSILLFFVSSLPSLLRSPSVSSQGSISVLFYFFSTFFCSFYSLTVIFTKAFLSCSFVSFLLDIFLSFFPFFSYPSLFPFYSIAFTFFCFFSFLEVFPWSSFFSSSSFSLYFLLSPSYPPPPFRFCEIIYLSQSKVAKEILFHAQLFFF